MTRKGIKVGDRVYYENFSGGIGSAIVVGIRPERGKDYYGKEFEYNWLQTGLCVGVEDYNTIAPSNPKVKAYIKETKGKREALVNEALMFALPDRKGFSKEERHLCGRLLEFMKAKYNEIEELELL